ncbi:hypothetical protein Tco_0006188 [Tanacetum coccineum]
MYNSSTAFLSRDSSSPPMYQSQCSQQYFLVHPFNIDDVEDLCRFFVTQHYSPTQDLGGLSKPVQDDFPTEEVAVVKQMVSRRRQKGKMTTKEESRVLWTQAEEIALCKGWINTSENSVRGNDQKSHGFCTEVLAYFEREMGESRRGYDDLNYKWKSQIRPKVGQFCSIYVNVVRRNHVGNTYFIKCWLL